MTLADIASGEHVFLDANVFVYHFAPHPTLGPACADLFDRIERGDVSAVTSTHVLSEAAHHLMTFEASRVFGWPSKIVERLKLDPGKTAQLSAFRQAIESVLQLPVRVLTIPAAALLAAASVSQRTGLLTNDALVVALMQSEALTNLASHDADFDRVPGLTRYAPL